MKKQNSDQDQKLDQNQNIHENEELNQGNQDIAKDKTTENTNKTISNSSQKGALREEEIIITIERNPNTETNILANLCGSNKEYNTKEKGIKQYLNSEELKTTLKNAGLNDDASQKVIEKLNEYLENMNAIK